jgi:hypothetical protein
MSIVPRSLFRSFVHRPSHRFTACRQPQRSSIRFRHLGAMSHQQEVELKNTDPASVPNPLGEGNYIK